MSERNMYHCLPCPKCNSEFRACFGDKQRCDDCGFTEPIDDLQRKELGYAARPPKVSVDA